jgi:holo-[acyl-carrier protein] synthase
MVLGLGCDIVQISRIEKQADALAKRILSEKELEIYEAKGKNQLEFLAGRFAAREALIKAGVSAEKTSAIEILNAYNGAPYLVQEVPGEKILLSISHEKDYAMATAIRERSES